MSKKRQEIKFPKGLKWIYVSLVVYFEGTKEEVGIIANDITKIANSLNLHLSREFYPTIEKVEKGWRITLIPLKTSSQDKTNLYSIENLNYDLQSLALISNEICLRYKIQLYTELPTYNPIFLDGAPALDYHDHLLVVKYHIHDRLNFARQNPKLDKLFLGSNESIYDIIEKIQKAEPTSEWSKKTRELIGN